MSQSTDSEPPPLFTPEEREIVKDLGSVIRFQPGSLIVKEGEDSDFVVLLHEGHVVIEKGQPNQITVGIRGPGELVGEMASLIKEPRTAGIRSIGEVEAQLIPASDWRAFLHQHPRALYAHAQQLAQKLKKSTQIGEDSLLTSEQKLIKILVKLADSGLGTEDKGGHMTFKNLSQKALAKMANISRESAVQVLRRLKADKIVDTGRQRLTILDLAALRGLADDVNTVAKQ
ncbi:CRP-like cAMP-binding protein [Stackebrandtia endophytica]|uniref:CRP-like cAMP-binding protein n=1 Tax=Stackebrandtia endophytica TaxID=1496996 RepID=A0A543ASJ1_9ACTN|nr:Crp/Fnr family transcriptional regulator [Stackebrandtia endophytica]TQL75551.1 CRP-like cAMP-binding protein [Stackebrandtia endophytica]